MRAADGADMCVVGVLFGRVGMEITPYERVESFEVGEAALWRWRELANHRSIRDPLTFTFNFVSLPGHAGAFAD